MSAVTPCTRTHTCTHTSRPHGQAGGFRGSLTPGMGPGYWESGVDRPGCVGERVNKGEAQRKPDFHFTYCLFYLNSLKNNDAFLLYSHWIHCVKFYVSLSFSFFATMAAIHTCRYSITEPSGERETDLTVELYINGDYCKICFNSAEFPLLLIKQDTSLVRICSLWYECVKLFTNNFLVHHCRCREQSCASSCVCIHVYLLM